MLMDGPALPLAPLAASASRHVGAKTVETPQKESEEDWTHAARPRSRAAFARAFFEENLRVASFPCRLPESGRRATNQEIPRKTRQFRKYMVPLGSKRAALCKSILCR